MGTKEGLDSLVKEIVRLEKLIEDGKLPDTVFPRLAYLGHKVINTFGRFGPNALYRCVSCMSEFNGDDDRNEISWRDPCPNCSDLAENIFLINDNKTAKWECKFCQAQWISEHGQVCPICKGVANG